MEEETFQHCHLMSINFVCQSSLIHLKIREYRSKTHAFFFIIWTDV